MDQENEAPVRPAMYPQFVIETPAHNQENPSLPTQYFFTDSTHDRAKVTTMFCLAQVEGDPQSAMYKASGNQGAILQMLASTMLQNPGMLEAIQALMVYLAHLTSKVHQHHHQ